LFSFREQGFGSVPVLQPREAIGLCENGFGVAVLGENSRRNLDCEEAGEETQEKRRNS
jgi:hypothetical protein